MEYTIREIISPQLDFIDDLALEATEEAEPFVQKTIDEWNSGENNFSAANEIFYAVYLKDSCVGIGGLNLDPYSNESGVGRVRHLYVSREHRKCGVGTLLLKNIIEFAAGHYTRIRLYTTNPVAGKFYEANGFSRSVAEKENYSLGLY
jgi:GNAT superfamily N-acetyltransferase